MFVITSTIIIIDNENLVFVCPVRFVKNRTLFFFFPPLTAHTAQLELTLLSGYTVNGQSQDDWFGDGHGWQDGPRRRLSGIVAEIAGKESC